MNQSVLLDTEIVQSDLKAFRIALNASLKANPTGLPPNKNKSPASLNFTINPSAISRLYVRCEL